MTAPGSTGGLPAGPRDTMNAGTCWVARDGAGLYREVAAVPLLRYLKTAFLNRWNLLVFLGASAFGLLSGRPDVVLPLVLAGEVAYLGLLVSQPRFRAAVEARQAELARTQAAQTAERMARRILAALPRELLSRFESLRAQCAELRQIALELRQPGTLSQPTPLEGFQAAGLERLLWIYLRLLYTHYALARFLEKTPEKEIESDIRRLEERLGRVPPDESDPQRQRMRKALEDNLHTSRARLENVRKARENFQLIALEIERLENKIRSLSEMAINRQEPEFITSEVDHVASSMIETERTMNELRFATGLDAAAEETPALLAIPLAQRR